MADESVAWSFSKLKAFEQCPKQFYHLRVIKDYKEPMSSAMFYGNQFHKAAENYINDYTPLPFKFNWAKDALDNLNKKEGMKLCELRLGVDDAGDPCKFFDDRVWYRGIIDLLILNDELAWIVDYKTSKSTQYADVGQLELMAMAIFSHYPTVQRINAGLLFVVCKELVKRTYTREDYDSLFNKWALRVSDMHTAYDIDVWNPKPSGLCKKHCVVTECIYNGRH